MERRSGFGVLLKMRFDRRETWNDLVRDVAGLIKSAGKE